MHKTLSLLLLVLSALPALGQAPPAAKADGDLRHEARPDGIPFDRYHTRDKLGRQVTFYLSVPGREAQALPLVVFVQGSGSQSLFRKSGEHVAGDFQNILFGLARGKARVLAVEKPGVKYLDVPKRPGGAQEGSEEFLREHTLPRWTEAVAAALRAARSLPGVDAKRVLVMGHSEGAIVAAQVAVEEPGVTHVACLSGSGPTQLFDLVEMARAPRRPDEPLAEREERAQQVYAEWTRIQADPESVTKFYLGHPYRRWASFLRASTVELLTRCQARIYLAHGTEDRAVPVASFDVLRAELAARGKDVTAERLLGADHGLRKPDEQPPAGLREVFGRVLEWFLQGGGTAKERAGERP